MIATDYSIEHAARDFRLLVGEESEYPCDLEASIMWALPLDVRGINRLRLGDVEAVALKIGLPYSFGGTDRRLCGCLLAYNDSGIIFVDAADTESERRFTLAHELAHFLLDYRAPRKRAFDALGESIRPVLDGLRPATIEERVCAVLDDVPLGVLSHLMERPSGNVSSSAVLSIESRADRMALELLAPAAAVSKDASLLYGLPYNERLLRLRHTLEGKYGLPPAIAGWYAGMALYREGEAGFRDWLLGTDR